jgi:serine protease Do
MRLHHTLAFRIPRRSQQPVPLVRLTGRALLLLAAVAVAPTPAQAGSLPPGVRRSQVVEVVDKVRAAVVNIHSERTVQAGAQEDLFPTGTAQNRVNGMGTGIVIDPRGYIITNYHVIEEVSLIRVRLSDGGTYAAKVLARDAEADLALIKIEPSRPMPVMPFGTSSDLMLGESVVAIGNAYGYENTVTTGIVSALKRDVTLNKEISYKSLIQTDASINPGNSGGPLLNINGELVGVNVAIRAGAQGIAFAIPVDTMLKVAADMMSTRKRTGTVHGLTYRDRVEPSAAGPGRSLVVERADGATPTGVQKGDVILQVGEAHVACGLELERALLDRPVGEHVPVVVRRNGVEAKAELLLQSPDKPAAPAQVVLAPAASTDLIWRKLGLRFNAVNTELVSRVNQHLHGGLAVSDVNPESPAGKAGIQRGDILVGLHQWETVTPDNVTYVITHPDLASFNPLRFYIVRNGQVHRGWLQQVE